MFFYRNTTKTIEYKEGLHMSDKHYHLETLAIAYNFFSDNVCI